MPIKQGNWCANSMVSGPTTFPDSRFRIPNQPALDSQVATMASSCSVMRWCYLMAKRRGCLVLYRSNGQGARKTVTAV
jgi:hypothetical protein